MHTYCWLHVTASPATFQFCQSFKRSISSNRAVRAPLRLPLVEMGTGLSTKRRPVEGNAEIGNVPIRQACYALSSIVPLQRVVDRLEDGLKQVPLQP